MDDLVEVVRGTQIVGRDLSAHPVHLPDRIADVATPDTHARAAQLVQEHPSDFSAVVDNWRRAVAEPGIVHTVRVRRRVDDRWYDYDVSALNLVDQPDVGAVITFARCLEEVEPPTAPNPGNSASFEAAGSTVQHLDEAGTILRTEGDVEQLFGRPAAELVGGALIDLLHPDDRDAALSMWIEVLDSPDNARTIQHRLLRPDGSTTWIQSMVMNRRSSDGTILAMSHDVSAVRAQQAALAAREAQLRFLTEVVPVGVFRATSEGIFTFVNPRWSSILGDARTIGDVLDQIAEEDHPTLIRIAEEARDNVAATQTRVCTADGSRHLEVRLQGVIGTEGEMEVIGTVDDVTSSVIRTFELQARAERDPLTGLANRRGLARTLEAAVTGARSALVLFGDLDDFKAVNDRWGHETGDRVLTTIGRRLGNAVRPGDVVGRWGGDEFVIVCLDVAEGHEHDVIDRLHAALVEPIEVDDRRFRTDVSLGVVRPRPGESGEDVLRRADTAMYEAKRAPRSRP